MTALNHCKVLTRKLLAAFKVDVEFVSPLALVARPLSSRETEFDLDNGGVLMGVFRVPAMGV